MAARIHPEGRKMRKLSLVSLACAAALVICPAVLSAQEWNFTVGGSINATGTIFGTLVSPGEYLLNSGSIDIASGGAVLGSGALAVNTAGATGTSVVDDGGTDLIYDDLLFPGSDPQLTGNGLVFV